MIVSYLNCFGPSFSTKISGTNGARDDTRSKFPTKKSRAIRSSIESSDRRGKHWISIS